MTAHGLSLVAACGSYSLVSVRGLLIAVASLIAEQGLQACGHQLLWRMGLDALRPVGSSQTLCPAVEGEFLTTGPPGKPPESFFISR